MKVKILIIDDHPSMIEGYKVILSLNDFGYEVEVTPAYNCEMALHQIEPNCNFDIAFVDFNLPAFESRNLNSGIDLAKIIRKVNPNVKIVFLTSHSESIVLYDIITSVNPEGLLVKSDFTADELLVAFDKIIKGDVYRSATVKNNVKELLSNKVYLDDYNRQIISLLSKGIKTKSMPNYINLSMSSIEKRKANIRTFLGIEGGNDEDIINAAKKAGLV
jgi:DNA-binding NarL/FixJ family response regulator